MIFKNSQRFFMLALVLVLFGCATGEKAHAQSQPLSEKEYKAIERTTENIFVYGKTYKIKLYTETYPAITWKEAKPYLPLEISTPNPALTTDDQILARIKALEAQKGLEYDAGFNAVVKRQMALQKNVSADEVEQSLGDTFMANGGARYSPTVQKVCNEYQALIYLYEMIYRSVNHKAPTF